MDKLTYLAELAEGLARWVPERERQDILRYYAEYFEEAGPDREAQVVQELGDPWALSCRLAVEGGYVTAEQANSWAPPKKKRWPWIALGVAAVLIFVVGSVASAASRIGRVIGQAVFSNVAVVEEDVAQAVPVTPDVGEITFIEGEAFGASVEVFDSIDADISLGNINVLAGDDYTVYIEQDVDLGDYSVQWDVKDGALRIKDSGAAKGVRVDGWEGFKELFGKSRRALEVTITVPEDAVLDKVVVTTDLGNVMLYGVYAAKVTAETGMGNVECYELRQVEKLDLETGMGDVTLSLEEPYDGVSVDLESGMGNVEAFLGGSERDWGYEAESGTGAVTIDSSSRGSKAERKGNYPYKLDAESGMGDVDVYFDEG